MNFLSEDFPLSTNERMKLALQKEPKIKPLELRVRSVRVWFTEEEVLLDRVGCQNNVAGGNRAERTLGQL